jgi:hypothetical protein
MSLVDHIHLKPITQDKEAKICRILLREVNPTKKIIKVVIVIIKLLIYSMHNIINIAL